MNIFINNKLRFWPFSIVIFLVPNPDRDLQRHNPAKTFPQSDKQRPKATFSANNVVYQRSFGTITAIERALSYRHFRPLINQPHPKRSLPAQTDGLSAVGTAKCALMYQSQVFA